MVFKTYTPEGEVPLGAIAGADDPQEKMDLLTDIREFMDEWKHNFDIERAPLEDRNNGVAYQTTHGHMSSDKFLELQQRFPGTKQMQGADKQLYIIIPKSDEATQTLPVPRGYVMPVLVMAAIVLLLIAFVDILLIIEGKSTIMLDNSGYGPPPPRPAPDEL